MGVGGFGERVDGWGVSGQMGDGGWERVGGRGGRGREEVGLVLFYVGVLFSCCFGCFRCPVFWMNLSVVLMHSLSNRSDCSDPACLRSCRSIACRSFRYLGQWNRMCLTVSFIKLPHFSQYGVGALFILWRW